MFAKSAKLATMEYKTFTIGAIYRLFDLDTPGDAWDLVLDKGWEHWQPNPPDTRWRVLIPNEDMPLERR